MSRKDKDRSRLGPLDRLSLSRQDKPSAQMGDLHLQQYGLRGRAAARIRRTLKRDTSRRSRRSAKSWLRRWQDNE